MLRLKLAMRSHQAVAKRLRRKAKSSSSQGKRAWVRQAWIEVAPRAREAWWRGEEVWRRVLVWRWMERVMAAREAMARSMLMMWPEVWLQAMAQMGRGDQTRVSRLP